MLDQRRDVLAALAQRRQPDRHDVEAVEQVLAEQPLRDQLAQVAVGRGDDPEVRLDRRAAADRHELARLQHAQQAGLGLERHVADLVEEQRAALGLLEAADLARVRAGERAALVAEQLALDQLARDRRHVDGDERAAAALAVVVHRARDELLAGAGFAVDHDRQVGAHQPRDDAVDLLHRRRAADDRQLLLEAAGRRRARRGAVRGRASARLTSVTRVPRSNGLGR